MRASGDVQCVLALRLLVVLQVNDQPIHAKAVAIAASAAAAAAAAASSSASAAWATCSGSGFAQSVDAAVAPGPLIEGARRQVLTGGEGVVGLRGEGAAVAAVQHLPTRGLKRRTSQRVSVSMQTAAAVQGASTVSKGSQGFEPPAWTRRGAMSSSC